MAGATLFKQALASSSSVYLAPLGLSQYVETFDDEGFEDSSTFAAFGDKLDVALLKKDFGMKRGHAMKLLAWIQSQHMLTPAPAQNHVSEKVTLYYFKVDPDDPSRALRTSKRSKLRTVLRAEVADAVGLDRDPGLTIAVDGRIPRHRSSTSDPWLHCDHFVRVRGGSSSRRKPARGNASRDGKPHVGPIAEAAADNSWAQRIRQSIRSTSKKKVKCPPKALFLRFAHKRTIQITAKPKTFRSGTTYGWSKAGGRCKFVLCSDLSNMAVLCSGPTLNASVRRVVELEGNNGGVPRSDSGSRLSPVEIFMSRASDRAFELEVHPCEFSTGSLGWEGHLKKCVSFAGRWTLHLQINVNIPILGSKEADDNWVPSSATATTSTIDFATIGRATIAEKDNLKKIKGIGPFIEERLNGIGIFKFSQIAAMTPKIEDDVTEAIMFFPGRVRRDEWVAQAVVLAAKSASASRRKR